MSAGRAATDPEAAAWAVLTHGATDPSVTKRAQALAALGTIGPLPRAAQLVEAGLSDKDWSVRQAAAASLGVMGSTSSIPKLRQALQDETPDVSFTAAKSLWEMGDRSGRDVFLEILAGERSDSPGLVRGAMRDAKAKFHNRSGLALMGVKEGAGYALGPFAIGVTLLEDALKDSTATARALSAGLLGTDTDPQSFQQLGEALGDKNWIVRAAAAKALGARSDKTVIPKLQARLEDDKDPVRYMAAASIIRLSIPKAKPRPLRRAPRKKR
ncbi:MAG TPA: HEAT repeat domain-containing protein [Bryobacterales bacterium]|nr:HEAT repeat domain-containing protein [Bryobacterales bacterium]